MDDRKFLRLLIAVSLSGLVLTAVHAVYICLTYPHSSIIQFIARELWL
ncbi:MAG: hypothetical protein IKI21_02555 [Oscillospiraceae bacterium]|nr:hypothetical protein [Oscillospiraceae bacterium]